ncbi:MFS transporter [Actinoallomurus iriomotensis]|uniref:MFS transporter n=1 Tax=Actinoallomurus iriomotensis TaxID=478107 RepID=A0A9W6SDA7_9ACTN|nr:MFS transporter [Actinoallomurus iriomotensis]GLY91483.1 MFS transporter [Actinoallomurus iriomotensis]
MRRLIPPLLTEPPFRRYWTGQTISLLGDEVSMIALPLTGVLVVHAGPAQMGYLMTAWLAPSLLFSLPAGVLVDRYGHRRRTMVAADLGRAALMASIPIAYAAGGLTSVQLYTVAFAVGTLSVLFAVADSTLFVSLVPPERYVSGNSLLHSSYALADAGGPGLGGALVQALSAPAALLADGLSYLASAFFLHRVRPREPAVAPGRESSPVGGFRFIAGSRVVRAALGATATINFFTYMFAALFVLYATTTLHVPPGLLGTVLSAGAAGGLLGSAITGRVAARIGIGPAFIAGCVVYPAPLFLIPAAGGGRHTVLTLLFLAEFGSGIGVMMLDISVGSIFAAIIPDRVRARVSGAYRAVNYGARPLGSLAAGVLGTTVGPRSTLLIAVAGAVAGAAWLLPSPLPHMRTLPSLPAENVTASIGASSERRSECP